MEHYMATKTDKPQWHATTWVHLTQCWTKETDIKVILKGNQITLQAGVVGVTLMMERGHSRDSCGASNVPFLDLDGGYAVGSIRDNSSTRTLRICVLCMPYYRKKFFKKNTLTHDLSSHFFLSLVPWPCQGPSCLGVSALTEPTGRKLILSRLCTAGVISHHVGPGSNETNFLREAVPGPAT